MTGTLTIYDIIPEIEKRLIDLLEEFLKADGGKFHLWEVAVFIPASNTFIHNIAGVNDALRADNYIAAITNLRSAMESLATVVYDGTAHLTEEQYERFLKKGRFYRREHGKWEEVGPRAMIRHAETALGIKMVKTYDECCSIVHFSSQHMSFLGRFGYGIDTSKKSTQIRIGSKDEVPPDEQRKLIDSTVDLATQLGRCIVSATEEKKSRAV